MKKTALFILMFICLSTNAQKVFVNNSDDGKIIAENFISFDEAVDSVVIKSKKYNFKFSRYKPFIKIKDSEGYNLISNSIRVSKINKINKKIYLVVAFGGHQVMKLSLVCFLLKKIKF